MTPLRIPRGLRALLRSVSALSVASAAAVGAQALPTSTMTLDEAVASTIAAEPTIANAAATLAAQQGVLQQAKGVFDPRFDMHGKTSFAIQQVLGSALQNEFNRRLQVAIPPPNFDDAAAILASDIPTNASLAFSDCQTASSFLVVQNVAGSSNAGSSPDVVLCFDSSGKFLGILSSTTSLGSAAAAALFLNLPGLNEALQAAIQVQLAGVGDQLRQTAIILRDTAAILRYERLLMGGVPSDEEKLALDLGGNFAYPFRNGTTWTTAIGLNSSEDNFKGKGSDPLHGDTFVPNTFTTAFGMSFDVPLAKGAGRLSAEAPVRAAEHAVSAARALYFHTASDSVRSTLSAYWDVCAAHQKLALLQQSADTQRRLLEASEELVKGEALAAIELERNRARVAQVDGQVASARQTLLAARLALARTTGRSASDLANAPEAMEKLDVWLDADPTSGGAATPDLLIAKALGARRDLEAAREEFAANRTLADAAKWDLKPLVSLSFNFSYEGLFESFDDRFYEVQQFAHALSRHIAGPSYGIALHFRAPLGNNSARGRLLQTESSATQSQITAADLGRTIRLRVRELVQTIAATKAVLAAQREALARLEETHAASVERFKAGDLSLLDTLITEQQLTDARSALVDTERTYLDLVAQLRFETGSLLLPPPAGSTDLGAAKLAPLGSPIL